jgi:hypothetical protein
MISKRVVHNRETRLLKVKFGSLYQEKIKTTKLFLLGLRGESQRDFLEKPF